MAKRSAKGAAMNDRSQSESECSTQVMRVGAARSVRLLFACAAALACLPASSASAAPEHNRTVAGIIYDAAIERPIGLAETAVGIGVAGLAYPLSLGSGSSDQILERCVSSPARNTFTRAIGHFESRGRSACSPLGFSWSLVRMSLSIVQRPLGLIFGDSPMSESRPDRRLEEIEVDGEQPAGGADELEV